MKILQNIKRSKLKTESNLFRTLIKLCFRLKSSLMQITKFEICLE